jgi:predicted transcriptional regulator
LAGIYSAINDGEAKREEFFKVKTKEKKKADDLVDAIKDQIPGSKEVKNG